MKLARACALSALFSLACGGGKEPAEAPDAAEKPSPAAADAAPASDTPAAEDSAATSSLPKECARKTGTCVPPKAFVQKLCSGSYPSVALYLFGNKSPW